jgi:glyoxylate/hydroxypyruvate reductase A
VLWRPPADLFARQPHLRAMFSLGAGVDGLLAMPSLPPDVPLVRMVGGGMESQMVEYALYIALREFRGFRRYGEDAGAQAWTPRPARARGDFGIGVLGLGVLGGAVARALADFGFDVAGWSRSPRDVPGVQCLHGETALDEVLAHADVLLLFLPATPSTFALLDAGCLARLREGAVVANLSRGELVDEDALLHALDSGRVAAAYLDVFRQEPLPPAHPFWTHANVHVTPHVAALTDIEAACDQVASKIRALESGGAISGIVDRKRGY